MVVDEAGVQTKGVGAVAGEPVHEVQRALQVEAPRAHDQVVEEVARAQQAHGVRQGRVGVDAGAAAGVEAGVHQHQQAKGHLAGHGAAGGRRLRVWVSFLLKGCSGTMV